MVLHLRDEGLGEGDEHPPTLSYNLQSMVDFTFTFDMGSIFDTEGQTVKVLG